MTLWFQKKSIRRLDISQARQGVESYIATRVVIDSGIHLLALFQPFATLVVAANQPAAMLVVARLAREPFAEPVATWVVLFQVVATLAVAAEQTVATLVPVGILVLARVANPPAVTLVVAHVATLVVLCLANQPAETLVVAGAS